MKTSRKYNSIKLLIISFTVIAVASYFIINIFSQLYLASRLNILGTWRNKTDQISFDVESFLKEPVDAVSFSSVTVNDMLRRDASTDEIQKYLVSQRQIYSSIISDNTTGIYGYCKGKYLDGSGWIPPKDYVPTNRPWYISALHKRGEIAFTKTYLNLQTNTYMISVSKLLDDNASVLSMDFFLDNIQNTIAKTRQDHMVLDAFIINSGGYLIASQNKDMIGKYLIESPNKQDKQLAISIQTTETDTYDMNYGNHKASVFISDINSDWKTVVVLDQAKMFASLTSIYVGTAIVLTVIIVALSATFIHLNNRRKESERLSSEVNAIADIYTSVLKIDIKKDTISHFRGFNELKAVIGKNSTGFTKTSLYIAEKISAPEFTGIMRTFMDSDTLKSRLGDSMSISQEFKDINNCWIRLRFIVTDRDDYGYPTHLLLAFESIDADRKQQENLRKISETDLMTGVKNRGTGEQLVREAVNEKTYGMFCLMDADNFKYINDTFGHKVGDKVIISIADSMKNAFRDSDIVFRLGGDEFAVFSPTVYDKETGEKLLERFFMIYDKVDIPELGDHRITLSVGATLYADPSDTFELIYQRADEATYDSKKISGNHISFK
ncbi:MAG: diguanylate cyclase [Lachnospiraceae bacterium]|nr:diguanylate cyclase [Lachnospiraceae bacterium]